VKGEAAFPYFKNIYRLLQIAMDVVEEYFKKAGPYNYAQKAEEYEDFHLIWPWKQFSSCPLERERAIEGQKTEKVDESIVAEGYLNTRNFELQHHRVNIVDYAGSAGEHSIEHNGEGNCEAEGERGFTIAFIHGEKASGWYCFPSYNEVY